MTKLIPFPGSYNTFFTLFFFFLTAPSIREAVTIVNNGAKTFLAKETATFISGPAHLRSNVSSNPPD